MHRTAVGVVPRARTGTTTPYRVPSRPPRGFTRLARGVPDDATTAPQPPGAGPPAEPQDALLGATLETLRRAVEDVEVERSLAEALQHSLLAVCICAIVASVAGSLTGYWFGRKTGPLLYKRKQSGFFRLEHLKAAETFYNKYGQYALTTGFLFPVIRTFAPIVAGMVKMNITRYVVLVFIGSVLWTQVLVLSGYLVGLILGLKQYLPYIMTGFILLVTTPIVIRIFREMKRAGKGSSEVRLEDD